MKHSHLKDQRMTAPRRRAVLIFASVFLGLPLSTAVAQHFSLRPQIGIYSPTKDLIAVSQSGDEQLRITRLVAELLAYPTDGPVRAVHVQCENIYSPPSLPIVTDLSKVTSIETFENIGAWSS